MLINLSNHPSDQWQEKQVEACNAYGGIVDLPFPSIDPNWGDEEIDRLVDEYEQKILGYDSPVIMVQGEFIFTYRLVSRLKNRGLTAVASCSARIATEKKADDGALIKQSRYEFVRFREY